VFLDQRSHIEAYELICAREAPSLSFTEFLGELRATYRAATDGRRGQVLGELGGTPPPDAAALDATPEESAETHHLLERALAVLSAEDRAAVELYVVEELSAADVARILGLPNAKAVHNRVYRALAAVRTHLAQVGVARSDL